MVLGPWIVRAGLVNTSCLTFESANNPGQFLRHSNSADLAPKCAPTELDQDTGTLKGVNIPIRLLSWALPVDGEAVGVAWCGTR
ncbi:AbfB domain-containing protein [Streptomyces sp. NBS 14/10]|uniref:AbfB domain-containing protein n=1 Tax=Streptomyces sp. NBS 14/10 TaxID=1945643 RepID=UPI000B7CCB40|nr:AbfB domain-containing protein [Streptomyces sp. NBS 14/10]KAK1183811.1 AbfB domain-containing protein [Streptomyces sp. NBS 14/10]